MNRNRERPFVYFVPLAHKGREKRGRSVKKDLTVFISANWTTGKTGRQEMVGRVKGRCRVSENLKMSLPRIEPGTSVCVNKHVRPLPL